MKLLSIQTAQNVPLEFEVGNVGKRLVAAILDLIAMGLYIYLAQFIISNLLSINIWDQPDVYVLEFFIMLLPVILYQPVIEYFWNGKTIGKAILKIQVIGIDGQTPSLGDLILRWLLRVIDIKIGFLFIFFIPNNPSSATQEVFMIWVLILMVVPLPVIGILTMVLTKTGQRLGDLVANTTVIETKRPFSLEQTILEATEEDYKPRFLNVLKLRDKDIHIIKTTLDEQKKIQDYKHVKELSIKAREILEIEENIKPLELLQTLIKDYNHLARKADQK